MNTETEKQPKPEKTLLAFSTRCSVSKRDRAKLDNLRGPLNRLWNALIEYRQYRYDRTREQIRQAKIDLKLAQQDSASGNHCAHMVDYAKQALNRVYQIATSSNFDETKALTIIRQDDPVYARIPVSVARATLKQLDAAYNGAYTKLRKTGKVEFPTFRPYRDCVSIGFRSNEGFRFREPGDLADMSKLSTKQQERKKLLRGMKNSNVGRAHHSRWFCIPSLGIRLKLNDRFERRGFRAEDITNVTLNLSPDGNWYFHAVFSTTPEKNSIVFERKLAQPRLAPVGIDMGLKTFVVASDGYEIARERHKAKLQKRLRRAQRKVARARRLNQSGKMRGMKQSKAYRKKQNAVVRLLRTEANVRKTYNHTASAQLIQRYSGVIVEDLKIVNMMAKPKKRKKRKAPLNRSLSDASFGTLVWNLQYKSKLTNTYFETVDPTRTTQTCSACGVVVKKKIELSDRVFSCTSCGSTLDRDLNAARNVLHKSIAFGQGSGVTDPSGASPSGGRKRGKNAVSQDIGITLGMDFPTQENLLINQKTPTEISPMGDERQGNSCISERDRGRKRKSFQSVKGTSDVVSLGNG